MSEQPKIDTSREAVEAIDQPCADFRQGGGPGYDGRCTACGWPENDHDTWTLVRALLDERDALRTFARHANGCQQAECRHCDGYEGHPEHVDSMLTHDGPRHVFEAKPCSCGFEALGGQS